MTYFLAFRLMPWGLTAMSDIYKYNDTDEIEYVPHSAKERANPYGNVYFVSVMPEYLRTRLLFVRTNLTPIWEKEYFEVLTYDNYIYAFKLLYYKHFRDIIPYGSNAKKVTKIAKKCLNETFKEYGKNDTKYYIVAVDYNKRSIHSLINVYIVQPLTKEEAIQFIKENEPLLLWELI